MRQACGIGRGSTSSLLVAVFWGLRMTPVKSSVVLDPEFDPQKNRDPSSPRIRCPLCGWSPRKDDLWSCSCGHEWNTFDTGGVCPACLHQWTSTNASRAPAGRCIRSGMPCSDSAAFTREVVSAKGLQQQSIFHLHRSGKAWDLATLQTAIQYIETTHWRKSPWRTQ